jgi:hypothetical protein
MVPQPEAATGTPRRTPAEDVIAHWQTIAATSPATYHSRIAEALSILNHRFDPAEPDVLAVTRALTGWSGLI